MKTNGNFIKLLWTKNKLFTCTCFVCINIFVPRERAHETDCRCMREREREIAVSIYRMRDLKATWECVFPIHLSIYPSIRPQSHTKHGMSYACIPIGVAFDALYRAKYQHMSFHLKSVRQRPFVYMYDWHVIVRPSYTHNKNEMPYNCYAPALGTHIHSFIRFRFCDRAQVYEHIPCHT